MNPYLHAAIGPQPSAASQANGSTATPTTTSATFVVIPEMTVTVVLTSGKALVSFSGDFNMQHNDNWAFAVFVDGVEATGTRRNMNFVSATGLVVTNGSIPGLEASTTHFATGLVPGSHTFDVRWIVTGGTARAVSTQRKIIVMEVQ